MNILPDWLTAWLASPWLPAVLFFGAFADAFIGTSLFVLGELFFVAGGYMLAQNGQWWIVPLIWLGALSGDLISYGIGRYYGKQIIAHFIRRQAKRRLHYRRAYRLMKKRGSMAIFVARITGPLSKLMPLLAGSMKLPFATVLHASLWGVMIGTLQFFLMGWALAKGLNYWDWLVQYFTHSSLWSGVTIVLALLLLIFTCRWLKMRSQPG